MPEPARCDRPLPTPIDAHPTLLGRPARTQGQDPVLALQRTEWVFYPRSHAPLTLEDDLEWREISGEGTLYTYTIARRPTAPDFAGEEPQIIAVVELDEGPRLTSTLVNVEEDTDQQSA